MHATKSLCMAALSLRCTSSNLCVTSGSPNTNSSTENPAETTGRVGPYSLTFIVRPDIDVSCSCPDKKVPRGQ